MRAHSPSYLRHVTGIFRRLGADGQEEEGAEEAWEEELGSRVTSFQKSGDVAINERHGGGDARCPQQEV